MEGNNKRKLIDINMCRILEEGEKERKKG